MRGALRAVSVCAGVAALAGVASGQVTNGFFEGFSGGSTGGYSGGGMTVDNPGTDGVGGAGDGYLRASRTSEGRFAVRSIGGDYEGDFVDAGITAIRFWLRDVDAIDPGLEVRVGVGDGGNFWVSNASWLPTDEWQVFQAGLTDASNWTQVRGGGSFEDALRNADRLQFRHEVLPIGDGASADPFAGSLGIDNIAFVPAPGAVGLLAVVGVGAVRRRR